MIRCAVHTLQFAILVQAITQEMNCDFVRNILFLNKSVTTSNYLTIIFKNDGKVCKLTTTASVQSILNAIRPVPADARESKTLESVGHPERATLL